MTQGPTLLTVIVNWRTPDMTLRAAAAALRAMDGIAGAVVIVDNHSGDGSFEKMTAHACSMGWTKDDRLRVVASGRNGGFGAGNNFGLRTGLSAEEQTDYVYLLNSDAFPEPDAIRHLIAFMDDHPKAGIVGSHVRGEDGVAHVTRFRFPTVAGEFEQAVKLGPVTRLLQGSVIPMDLPAAPARADWVAGASMMLRRDMIDRIGGFDETFFLYFEETDLCLRAARAGWETWYLPHSRVVHVGSVSTGMKSWTRTPDYWFASRRHYFVKNHGRVYLLGATLMRAVGAGLWRLRCALTRRPVGEPRFFLRDLIAQDIAAMVRLPRRVLPVPLAPVLKEDGK